MTQPPIHLIATYELGHPPLGVASAAGFLERAGFEVTLQDISVARLDEGKLERASLIAISVPMHTALRLAVEVARRIRQANPTAHLCFFGLYAGLNQRYLLAGVTDSVISGEVEEVLVELARRLERGGKQIIRGLAESGRPAVPVLEKLDFAPPSRAGLPGLEHYAQLLHQGRMTPVGYVEASRGCLFLCRHCPIPPIYRGRFFIVPLPILLEDIDRQVAAGARHISIGDPDFLNGPGHALSLVREMARRHPGLTFDFVSRVSLLLKHHRLLPELKQLGCLFVTSAVESLSDEVLFHLDKGHSRADVVAVCRLMAAVGIVIKPTWVAFTPWTTAQDYLAMLEFALEEGLLQVIDPVQYTLRLLVPPSSLLLEAGGLTPHLTQLNQARFTWEWRHPDPRMDGLQQQVVALAREGAETEADHETVYEKIRILAEGLVPAGAAAPWSLPPPPERRPPRLTEDWYC